MRTVSCCFFLGGMVDLGWGWEEGRGLVLYLQMRGVKTPGDHNQGQLMENRAY